MSVVTERLPGVEPPPERRTYTAAEAAALIGVGERTLRRALARGEMKAIRVGARWAVPKAWLDRLLAGEGE